MAFEFCFKCDDPTGRAGRSEDSIYVDLPDGSTLGPFCETCHESYWQKQYDEAPSATNQIADAIANMNGPERTALARDLRSLSDKLRVGYVDTMFAADQIAQGLYPDVSAVLEQAIEIGRLARAIKLKVEG